MALNAIAYRHKAKLNQQQFWSKIGITQSGGSRYENKGKNARRMPKPVELLLLIAYGSEKERARVLKALTK